MNKTLAILTLIASAAACGLAPPTSNTEGAERQTLSVTFPAGDRQAGRQAFVDLGCVACHAVPSAPGLPAPVSASPGPPIEARLADRDVSYLATAIVSPSHALSPDIDEEVRARLAGVLSPMGDYSQSMTVRQLVDLHAFIRSVR